MTQGFAENSENQLSLQLALLMKSRTYVSIGIYFALHFSARLTAPFLRIAGTEKLTGGDLRCQGSKEPGR